MEARAAAAGAVLALAITGLGCRAESPTDPAVVVGVTTSSAEVLATMERVNDAFLAKWPAQTSSSRTRRSAATVGRAQSTSKG